MYMKPNYFMMYLIVTEPFTMNKMFLSTEIKEVYLFYYLSDRFYHETILVKLILIAKLTIWDTVQTENACNFRF